MKNLSDKILERKHYSGAVCTSLYGVSSRSVSARHSE